MQGIKRRSSELLALLTLYIGLALALTPYAIFHRIFIKRSPRDLLSYDGLGNAIFSIFWLAVGRFSSKSEEVDKLFKHAHGIVLDLGPGAGYTVNYFRRNQCTKIFGVEPNVAFHEELQKNVEAAGLADIYTIVPCGIEDTTTLLNYGIGENSFDTIVACKVLCSVPKPDAMCKNLYKYLAPGGSLVALEHTKSHDRFTWMIQSTLNHIWKFLFAGCNVIRPTQQYLLEAGPWSEKRIERPEGTEDYDIVNWMVGKFTK